MPDPDLLRYLSLMCKAGHVCERVLEDTCMISMYSTAQWRRASLVNTIPL